MFKCFSIFSIGGHLVQQSRTILTIVAGPVTQGAFLRNYLEIRPLAQMLFKGFSIFSSGGQFVQRSRAILAILIGGHPKNISVKLF